MSDNIEDIVDNKVLEDAQLDNLFEDNEDPDSDLIVKGNEVTPATPTGVDEEKAKKKEVSFTQWALGGNSKFTPVGESITNLVAGVYEPFSEPGVWGLEKMSISSDQLYELPDMATNMVLEEAEKFWNHEDRYRKHNLLYKRGIILWGPPGSGKTVTVKLLIKKLIQRNGIVIVAHNVQLTSMCLKAIKRIEPERNLICIFEDIDEILKANGESHVLSVLDGEHNVDRVMNIATTNYPERLGARIFNRPSRFDRRVFVGMPGDLARESYLEKATSGSLGHEELLTWVKDTKDMSIAHLRELVVAVYCLDQPYKDVIERLSEMAKQVKVADEFKTSSMGFTPKKTSGSGW